ncbi:MAG: TetR/AcrR family transcriptional regulator [Actinobacteria bacterium]|nr:TetR/AcrR family transcriptional regulator [Actinomycetota bacterium]
MTENRSASAERGRIRREAILDAAMELFAEQGFVLTSLPMISQKVGITHAGILHHFGSKEGVLRALLEREGPAPHFGTWVLDISGIDVVAKLPDYAEIVIQNPLAMELQFQLFWENRHASDPMHEEVLRDVQIRNHIAHEIRSTLGAKSEDLEIDLEYNIFAFVIGANSQWLVSKDDELLRRSYRRYTDSALRVLQGQSPNHEGALPLV